MSISPRSPYILLKLTGETQTSGGLFMPAEDDVKALRTAKVVKASSSCDGDPLEVGSLVYVLPKSGHKMQADGEDYLLVKSEDIVAVQL